ncbi:MAG: hypothetical protein U9R73_00535 [Pseudomonadota bacterium]|nr:hypothetical protein [Pseudomonadota bacterium]
MADLDNAAPAAAPAAPSATKSAKPKSVKKGGATDAVRVRCKQSGFMASIPAEDWNAYTPAQRAAYEIMEI